MSNKSIQSIPTFEVSSLKEQYLHEYKIDKRRKNAAKIEDFYKKNAKIFIVEGLYINGPFLMPVGSEFLTSIIIDKLDNYDLSDYNRCKDFLYSKRGVKIQKARFRDEFIKPINRWMRNRDVIDHQLAVSLVRAKMEGWFDDIASFMDDTKSYSMASLLRFKASS
jgi:hypothetical protein